MKKLILLSLFTIVLTLSSCKPEIECGEGTVLFEGTCVATGVKNPNTGPELSPIDQELENFTDGAQCKTSLSDYQADDYTLVWEDEFTTNVVLDEAKWEYMIGNGNNYGLYKWGNEEEQFYTKYVDNIEVKEGLLRITAMANNGVYTSARIRTKDQGDWKYGVMEVCAKLPDTLGTWPAIWMLPTDSPHGGWPYGGEIDIMEAVGFESNTIHYNIHTEANNWGTSRSVGTHTNIPGINTSYHAYAVKWVEDKIEFYVDGTIQFTYNPATMEPEHWPFDSEFHLLLNVAIGGTWGGQRGIKTGNWEDHMFIDYVRVYQE